MTKNIEAVNATVVARPMGHRRRGSPSSMSKQPLVGGICPYHLKYKDNAHRCAHACQYQKEA